MGINWAFYGHTISSVKIRLKTIFCIFFGWIFKWGGAIMNGVRFGAASGRVRQRDHTEGSNCYREAALT